MEYSLLIRLIMAHLLSDFVFQPTKWVIDKDAKGFRSGFLYRHLLVTAFVAMILVWDFSWLLPVGIITVIHGVTDGVKSRINRHSPAYSSTIYLFLTDQVIHLLTISIVWLLFTSQSGIFYTQLTLVLQNQKFWIYLVGYTWITIPLAVIIGKITEGWSNELNVANYPNTSSGSSGTYGKHGLKNAGKWIGIIERILILTFVINQQFAAIGFMLAAKSVFRFGDLKESKDHKKTEYIIIGSFLSFMLSILTGIVLNYVTL